MKDAGKEREVENKLRILDGVAFLLNNKSHIMLSKQNVMNDIKLIYLSIL